MSNSNYQYTINHYRMGGAIFNGLTKAMINKVLKSWFEDGGQINMGDIWILRSDYRKGTNNGYVTGWEWLRLTEQGLFNDLHWRGVDYTEIKTHLKEANLLSFYDDYYGVNLNSSIKGA